MKLTIIVSVLFWSLLANEVLGNGSLLSEIKSYIVQRWQKFILLMYECDSYTDFVPFMGLPELDSITTNLVFNEWNGLLCV